MRKIAILFFTFIVLVMAFLAACENESNRIVIWQYRNFEIPNLDRKFLGWGEKHLYKANSVVIEDDIIHVKVEGCLTFKEKIMHALMKFGVILLFITPDFAFHEFTFDLNLKR